MGTLKYPGAPDFTYSDQILANIQAIIAVQQKMGQGFWLERRGMDDKLVGHDAVWIDPSMPIYIEFDSLDDVVAEKIVLDEWKMLLTIGGADRLVFKPDAETLARITKFVAEEDSSE